MGGSRCFIAGWGGLIAVITAAALRTGDVAVVRSGKAFLSVFQYFNTGRSERIYRHAELVGKSG